MVRGLKRGCALIIALGLAGCTPSAPPPPPAPAGPPPGPGVYLMGAPYQVNGHWFYPAQDLAYDEKGVGQVYGPDFHPRLTANGEGYDPNKPSAAHQTLPLPAVIQVTNLDNGRMVQLRVNDRGPPSPARILGLSPRAGLLLAIPPGGTAKLRIRVLGTETMQAQGQAKLNGSDTAPGEVATAAPRAAVTTETLAPPPGAIAAPSNTGRFAGNAPATTAAGALHQSGSLKGQMPVLPPETVYAMPVTPQALYVQAGVFARPASAYALKSRIDSLGAASVVPVQVKGLQVYRVRFGPMPAVAPADALLTRLFALGIPEAKLVVEGP